MDTSDEVAVITGAEAGISRAAALALVDDTEDGVPLSGAKRRRPDAR